MKPGLINSRMLCGTLMKLRPTALIFPLNHLQIEHFKIKTIQKQIMNQNETLATLHHFESSSEFTNKKYWLQITDLVLRLHMWYQFKTCSGIGSSLNFAPNIMFIICLISEESEKWISQLNLKWILLQEETCSHLSFNTNTGNNHAKKKFTDSAQNVFAIRQDCYFQKSHNGSRNEGNWFFIFLCYQNVHMG